MLKISLLILYENNFAKLLKNRYFTTNTRKKGIISRFNSLKFD